MVTVWRTTFLHYIRFSLWGISFEGFSLFLVMKRKAFHQSATEEDKKGQNITLDERPIPRVCFCPWIIQLTIMYEIWVDLKELLPNSYITPPSFFVHVLSFLDCNPTQRNWFSLSLPSLIIHKPIWKPFLIFIFILFLNSKELHRDELIMSLL